MQRRSNRNSAAPRRDSQLPRLFLQRVPRRVPRTYILNLRKRTIEGAEGILAIKRGRLTPPEITTPLRSRRPILLMRHMPARLVFSPNATGPLHEPGRCPRPSKSVPSPANWEDPYLCKKSMAVLNQRIPRSKERCARHTVSPREAAATGIIPE